MKEGDKTQTRIIVKNIPKKTAEGKIRSMFSEKGTVTDLKIPKREDGEARGFCYIGYETNEHAVATIKHFNGTYIGTNKIEIEMAKGILDKNITKTWSKHTKKRADDFKPEDLEKIRDTGRLFIRNLSYNCAEEDLEELFKKYGRIIEVHMPINFETRKTFGVGFVLFMIPEDAVTAFKELDGIGFQGRLVHILPGEEKKEGMDLVKKRFKRDDDNFIAKESRRNMFINPEGALDKVAKEISVDKAEIVNLDETDVAVKKAAAETHVISKTREQLDNEGVNLDSTEEVKSKNILLMKNISEKVTLDNIKEFFGKFGEIEKVIYPKVGTICIIKYKEGISAKQAVREGVKLQKDKPLFIEYAPKDILSSNSNSKEESDDKRTKLIIKNIAFEATEKELESLMAGFVRVKRVKLPNKVGGGIRGFGFAEFYNNTDARRAKYVLKETHFYGRRLVLDWAKE
eukprot:GHVP01028930.1.p1 GENE.GHVP01028930.1~~GHVP01028930.1.p1  ORF type:complete len:458 (+),score=120.59 GHVP01028930.1:28-1401(+)